jgi:twitching motility protein PilT
MTIQDLLVMTNTRNASDLHLVPGHSPTVRINGELRELQTFPELSAVDLDTMVAALLNPVQKENLAANKEVDFSSVLRLDTGDEVRFRSNAYYQRGTLALAFRLIPAKIKTVEELGLPKIMHDFVKLKSGFVLLTGASGQGKSTTLASVINEIRCPRNKNKRPKL